ncbi:nicotinamide phosphoribosyltransferase [Chloropicon primus]|uniref:Nicotinamide phosphoribosyltransferase n=1 Tax=Chloropicon primus TaxID=1764295 RepID=A0A5B8MY27_9CHLO|nr:nicotinamide phosphoribosyltransferase [Chloropicon primus]|eukprot:QDZ24410.1 nicotinamide phosphoribosyltransferase [Chloropicon primus]
MLRVARHFSWVAAGRWNLTARKRTTVLGNRNRMMARAFGSESLFGGLPIGILSDSYKAGHFTQYPKATEASAYGEFRRGYNKDKEDTRCVFYGIRYIVETFLHKKWTKQEVDNIAKFYDTHKAPFNTRYPWPEDLFYSIVEECDGYFPIKLEALPEGTCVNSHVPVFQITAEGKYTGLVTFFETLLCQVWYPTTVATLSRRCRQIVEDAFDRSVEEEKNFLIPSRLHDFGFRGCTCAEQSVIGGCAHLLNFEGSDTMSAAYYAQFVLNGGKPVASSIPATEHSVMMSWETEKEAIENMIEVYGDGLFACVMDSYDYAKALNEILPSVASKKNAKGDGGYMVLRPDSGDPVEAVLMALEAAEKVFGCTTNAKGYKVINGCGVIQGDGINIDGLRKILEAAMAAGYSAENVAFGMGGGLLQKVNRDTMSFATKLSAIVPEATGVERIVMKAPKTDVGKTSLPGKLAVKYVESGDGFRTPTVFPKDQVGDSENLLRVVYDQRPKDDLEWDSFEEVRARVAETWSKLRPNADAVSDEMKALQKKHNPHFQ